MRPHYRSMFWIEEVRLIYSTHLFRHLRTIIGRNIHRLRAARKLTLDELAKRSGVCASAIDFYELGKGEIHLNQLLRLACAMGVDVTALLATPKT